VVDAATEEADSSVKVVEEVNHNDSSVNKASKVAGDKSIKIKVQLVVVVVVVVVVLFAIRTDVSSSSSSAFSHMIEKAANPPRSSR
jgi:cell division protein FtsX